MDEKKLKNVWISFHSVHSCDEEEPDSLDFSTDGEYLFLDDVGCLSYQERRVEVLRSGTVTSRMVFEEGRKNSFLYSTPFGDATMGVDTRKIRRHVDENGGRVEIDYVVDMEHAVVARNKFEITIRQTGEA